MFFSTTLRTQCMCQPGLGAHFPKGFVCGVLGWFKNVFLQERLAFASDWFLKVSVCQHIKLVISWLRGPWDGIIYSDHKTSSDTKSKVKNLLEELGFPCSKPRQTIFHFVDGIMFWKPFQFPLLIGSVEYSPDLTIPRRCLLTHRGFLKPRFLGFGKPKQTYC